MADIQHGVFEGGSIGNRLPESRPNNDLRELILQTDYVPFNPLLFPLTYPKAEFDPLATCFESIGLPESWCHWEYDRAIFDTGYVGKSLGIPPNVIFGILRSQWSAVANFISSIVLHGGELGEESVSLQWQRNTVCTYLGRFELHSIVVVRSSDAIVWEEQRPLGEQSLLQPRCTQTINAASVGDFLKMVHDGESDPLTKHEDKHGFKRFLQF